MLPLTVCTALADRDRLRLFGTICREPAGTPVASLHLDPKGRKALTKLLAAGLVERDGDRFVVKPETFRRAVVDYHGEASASLGVIGASDRVAALFSRGKLVSIPRPGALRTELLRFLADRFARDRAYSEAEVRDLLQLVHPDHATLRRFMVDEGILHRDNFGTYWRPD
ncbi:MAG TPA: DUF2087 domain-containing protein [Streptosporangiaceae bacterium]|nr:DUF2087 domain-containing protein [Streptosporangiaceae bacterium]